MKINKLLRVLIFLVLFSAVGIILYQQQVSQLKPECFANSDCNPRGTGFECVAGRCQLQVYNEVPLIKDAVIFVTSEDAYSSPMCKYFYSSVYQSNVIFCEFSKNIEKNNLCILGSMSCDKNIFVLPNEEIDIDSKFYWLKTQGILYNGVTKIISDMNDIKLVMYDDNYALQLPAINNFVPTTTGVMHIEFSIVFDV